MLKAILLTPALAAILFTVPKSWQLINQAESTYIPVIFELLLLVLGYLVALVINVVLVIPVNLAVQQKTRNLMAGIVVALFLALVGTTVAYAYEIFGYRASILEPEYLYPLFIPLALMSMFAFWLLANRKPPKAQPETQREDQTETEEASR
ncbi:MAG: hypothetical protein WD601_09980 [Pseudohongiellaceae bacterium]